MTFSEYFHAATGYSRYDYQRRLACGEHRDHAGVGGAACRSQLINIPTGLGKTAAVVLAWLWNRVHLQKSEWPRRLVYCLPMRTLVKQTRDAARQWIESLVEKNLITGKPPRIVILMGGEELEGNARDWDIYPEDNAILIGTQDMLLSRALNRGYGMSRYRWPMHFGLLNNDCLWVMDEMQLMGAGLSTACQLEAFRGSGASGFGSFGGDGSVTWYMSATNNPDHLRTREWRGVNRPEGFEFGLTAEEKAATTGEIYRRRSAVKRIEMRQGMNLESPELATNIFKIHAEMLSAITGTDGLPRRTLIICNTVDRATAVHALLAKQQDKLEACDLLLLHSRFRPPERRVQMKRLEAESLTASPKGQIVVATQVIEAGVNVSSGVLWSEIAPLASLVQRLGRLNRAGEFNESNWEPLAVVFGIKPPDLQKRAGESAAQLEERKKEAAHLPYGYRNSEAAWAALGLLNMDASPANLETIREQIEDSIPRCRYSLQRHELLDFFDTDANLSLGFTDVSPFVRGLDDDTDLQVLWRERWLQKDGEEGTGEPGFTPDFQRDELCAVPVSKARSAPDILNQGWLWRGKESGWMSVRDVGLAPGMTILLPLEAGGYDKASGWTGEETDNKHGSHYMPEEVPTDEEQLSSLANGWQSIAVHTEAVADELRNKLCHLLASPKHKAEHDALLSAVQWHDVGKNHSDWQQAVLNALKKAGITGKEAHQPFAKFSLSDSPCLTSLQGEPRRKRIRTLRNSFRPGIAHEVASALAFRAHEQARLGSARDTNLASLLAEYVIMSHHGRVRKVLRDEMPKLPDCAKDENSVRGVSDGDTLRPVEIEDRHLGCDTLSTDCRRMGRGASGHESYTRGVLRLLEHYGPFRVAFFEAIFRAADIRASILAKGTQIKDTIQRELDGKCAEMAVIAGGAEAAAAMGSHSGGCGPEYGFREGAGGGELHSRDTRPDRATRHIETARGILSYQELAPLLAERVTRLEAGIYSLEFAQREINSELIQDFHRRICGDLVPDWGGIWRNIEVTVGPLRPPSPHKLPVLMREYERDLMARLHHSGTNLSELTLELLAFAEGRFLSIHPFRDFNGRTIRVFLLELLRRLDLPRVQLAPQTEAGRAEYFLAVEAADNSNWSPLVGIWRNRFLQNK